MRSILKMVMFSIGYFWVSYIVFSIFQFAIIWYLGRERWETLFGGSCENFVANYYDWNIYIIFDYSLVIVSAILGIFIYFRYIEIPISFQHKMLFGLVYAGTDWVMMELLINTLFQHHDFSCYPLWPEVMDGLILISSPVIVGVFYNRYVLRGGVKGELEANGDDDTPIEEREITAEMRCIAWRTFFAQKKISVIMCFLLSWVITPIVTVGEAWHIKFEDFSSSTMITVLLSSIILYWFMFLFCVIGEFARFHGFKKSIWIPYHCVKSSFVSKFWRQVCFVTVMLFLLMMLYLAYVALYFIVFVRGV